MSTQHEPQNEPESNGNGLTITERFLMLAIMLLVLIVAGLMVASSAVRLERLMSSDDQPDVNLTVEVMPALADAPVGPAVDTEDEAADVPADEAAETPVGDDTEAHVNLDPQQIDEAEFDTAAQILAAAREVQEDARQATTAAEIILSFLEGASVLVVLALGAAAIYGFRNAQETRKELKDEMTAISTERSELREMRKLINDRVNDVETSQQDAQNKLREDIEADKVRIGNEVDELRLTTMDLLEAHQHLRSEHHQQAYDAAQRVLDRDPDNPEALYISGWLKMQYVKDTGLDEGIEELERAKELAPDRLAISAALGVLVRRKASEAEEGTPERRALFNEAQGLLHDALGTNDELLDLSGESLYGPIAGLYRDEGHIESAIKSYEEAVRVTPGSAYPRGNLAGLYLQRYRQNGDQQTLDDALKHFRRTLQLAETRLVLSPDDHFLLMDIAMAQMILAQYPPDRSTREQELIEARDRLQEAVDLDRPSGMWLTSLTGWRFLRDACPDDWPMIRESLEQAVTKIEAQKQNASPEADNADNNEKDTGNAP